MRVREINTFKLMEIVPRDLEKSTERLLNHTLNKMSVDKKFHGTPNFRETKLKKLKRGAYLQMYVLKGKAY